MQLFLFLFFNLLLKIFPAEPCWISPIALCDGRCISGYCNLNSFWVWGGVGICVALFLSYLEKRIFFVFVSTEMN